MAVIFVTTEDPLTAGELGPVTRPAPVDVTITYTDPEATPPEAVTLTILANDFPAAISVSVTNNVLRLLGSSANLMKSVEGIKYVIGTQRFVQAASDLFQVPKEGDVYSWKPNSSAGEVYEITIRAQSTGPAIDGPNLRTDTFMLTVVNNWDADRDRIVALATDNY